MDNILGAYRIRVLPNVNLQIPPQSAQQERRTYSHLEEMVITNCKLQCALTKNTDMRIDDVMIDTFFAQRVTSRMG
jgi:hypothetical protein